MNNNYSVMFAVLGLVFGIFVGMAIEHLSARALLLDDFNRGKCIFAGKDLYCK